MNKLVALLALLFLAGYVAADSFIFSEVDGKEFKMYTDRRGDYYYVGIKFDFERDLRDAQAIAVVCVDADYKYKIKNGADAFMFQAWCAAGHCDKNYQNGYILMGSSVSYSGGDLYWDVPNAPYEDVSQFNMGTPTKAVGDGDDAVTYYLIPKKNFPRANIPYGGEPDKLVCFFRRAKSLYDVNPLTRLKLGSKWESDRVLVKW